MGSTTPAEHGEERTTAKQKMMGVGVRRGRGTWVRAAVAGSAGNRGKGRNTRTENYISGRGDWNRETAQDKYGSRGTRQQPEMRRHLERSSAAGVCRCVCRQCVSKRLEKASHTPSAGVFWPLGRARARLCVSRGAKQNSFSSVQSVCAQCGMVQCRARVPTRTV